MTPLQWRGKAKIHEIGANGLDSSGSQQEKVAGFCEIGNELWVP
jgi:hypothetical protein